MKGNNLSEVENFATELPYMGSTGAMLVLKERTFNPMANKCNMAK